MSARASKSCAHKMPRAERIGQLNDQLRMTGMGGRIVVTRGVQALPGFDAAALLHALAAFDAFDADNDPHGERDLGDVVHCGAELLWKIDYYDPSMQWGSCDPADPRVTTRVLTIMLPSEY